jgi:hypothetical protein
MAHIVPLLKWSSSPVAAAAWTVVVQTAGMNQALLDEGLKEDLILTVERAAELPDAAQRQLSKLVASVIVHSLWSAQTKLRWLLELTRASTPEFCASFIQSVCQNLAEATKEVVAKCWTDWMRAYLAARVEGRPRTLNTQEASALAEWVEVLESPPSIEKAIEYICLMPAALSLHPRLRKVEEDRIKSSPNAYAQLLAHLLTNTARPLYWGRDIEKLYMILTADTRTERATLRIIREQALRLGIESATGWPD